MNMNAIWLTPAQIQVSQLVAQGKSDKEIASLRKVSVRSVRDMLCRLYSRIGVQGTHSRVILAVLTWQLGLIK